MFRSTAVRHHLPILPKIAALTFLLLYFAAGAAAQTIHLTNIDPPNRPNLTDTKVAITLTGSGFTDTTTLGFAPNHVIHADTDWKQTNGTSATVTLVFDDPNPAVDAVSIWLINGGSTSEALSFSTRVSTTECLETLQTGECSLRIEVDASSTTASSSQSNNNTAPNILVKLDYLWRSPQNRSQRLSHANQVLASRGLKTRVMRLSNGKVKPEVGEEKDVTDVGLNIAKLNNSFTDHLFVRGAFQTGYTEVVTATKVQPATSSGGTTTTTTCPGGTPATSTTCTAAVPQPAFVVDAATKFGWSSAVDGQTTFVDLGIGLRGSFQYLIPSDKVVQNGGLTFIDLSSANPQNAVGFYEATGHFRLSEIGHGSTVVGGSGTTQNVSDLLVFEAGYQNNRGLQKIAANPLTNTRNRYVARFYVNPELPGSTHTKIVLGLEYSGGMNGGPHVIQLFFGTNLNPPKLFQSH